MRTYRSQRVSLPQLRQMSRHTRVSGLALLLRSTQAMTTFRSAVCRLDKTHFAQWLRISAGRLGRLGAPVWFLCVVGSACTARVSGDANSPSGDNSPPLDGEAAGTEGERMDPEPAPSPALVDDHGRSGILGCPTIAYPGSSSTTVNTSAAFKQLCGTCHGAGGEGKPLYPTLPGNLTREQFVAKVRGGVKNMPAFAADIIDDATLGRDFDAMRTRSKGAGSSTQHPSQNWSAAEVAAKRTEGLLVWRKPDAHGASCAGCHAPDAIDLAVIGYEDAAILRRASLHLPAKDGLALVDFVHAQRRNFGIDRPCSPQWRPFQPGGEVLPGNTPAEQDLAFFEELKRRKFLVATGRVMNVDDAERAWRQLAEVDIRTLPNGIPLPRWTEDHFDGEEHRSINDWISAVPRIPKDGAWYALVDRYLDDPSETRIVELSRKLEHMTTDDGTLQKKHMDSVVNGDQVYVGKSASVLLASHFFRMALLGRKGWNELESPPFARKTSYGVVHGLTFNPMRTIGSSYQEDPCFGDPLCLEGQRSSMPDIAKVELDPNQPFQPQMNKLTHPWWTLAMLFDPLLTASTDPNERTDKNVAQHGFLSHEDIKYWTDFFDAANFPQQQIHRPFFAAAQSIKRIEHIDLLKGPGHILDDYFMVGGGSMFISGGFRFDSIDTHEHRHMVINLMRMFMFKMKAAGGTYPKVVAAWKTQLGGVTGSKAALQEDRALAADTLKM